MGYEAVDNLPLSLLPSAPRASRRAARRRARRRCRTRDFAPRPCSKRSTPVAEPALEVSWSSSIATTRCCERRYTETRRRHPLALDRPVADGIRQERELLAPCAIAPIS